jgi:hypothetical protein
MPTKGVRLVNSPSLAPAMADFAMLSDYSLSPAYHGRTVEVTYEEQASYAWGTAHPTEPVRIERHMGRKVPGDVVWIDGGIREFVVSGRVTAVLDGFTGWVPYPVELYDGRGAPVPGYVGVAITGRCGPLRADLTRVEGEGRWSEYVGLWFPLESWDGSDVFLPTVGRMNPVVSGSLAKALRRTRLSGAQVTPLPAYRSIKAAVDRGIELGRGA